MIRLSSICKKYLKKQILYPSPQFSVHSTQYKNPKNNTSPHEVAEQEEKESHDWDAESRNWGEIQSTDTNLDSTEELKKYFTGS
tara:strand:+ start:179 stop:430 length:252 start_codon:yes stop_codon:yes gene_type:complete